MLGMVLGAKLLFEVALRVVLEAALLLEADLTTSYHLIGPRKLNCKKNTLDEYISRKEMMHTCTSSVTHALITLLYDIEYFLSFFSGAYQNTKFVNLLFISKFTTYLNTIPHHTTQYKTIKQHYISLH